MASLPRPVAGRPSRRDTGAMRPPPSRVPSARAQPATQAISNNARLRAGTVSPSNSVISTGTTTSRSRTPTGNRSNGTKRKEREFDHEPEQETNIHVVVRCRGRNDREVRENSGVVLKTDGVKGKSVELSMGPSALSNKTYHFDKVFSPSADQNMIYDEVVTPILDEMLAGYNCTIFAYGQTGTGKTYTMSGDMSDTLGLVSDSAGIIPRVLQSLFTKLEADDAESSVKCSFIELYNEELRDLLSADDGAKLKIYDDNNKKGGCATLVQGMEESHIKSAVEGVKLLGDGSHKRQVAATKCNDLSSRSHTVFTVTVYVKRTTDTGEDFVSAGKLNLVDLAGSENIQRSGAENKRAAEAGLINKSLLTLGRVINALVDKSSHIPYRESKLTRLLQDSLGGRTKTCIIATVSPAKSNLEETISTLDYAFRAKNIRNKPQVNQMISKKTLLREFTAEIEKLKSELIATRQRNGVYLTAENYDEITKESESRRILSDEQREKLEMMEANLRNKIQELFSITTNFQTLKKDHEGTKFILDETKGVLEKTEIVLETTRTNLAEETLLRKAHQSTEEQLNMIGGQLISTLGKTVSDVGGLHAKIRRKSDLQTLNRQGWKSSQEQVYDVTRIVEQRIEEFRHQHEQLTAALSAKMSTFVKHELDGLQASQSELQSKVDSFAVSEKEVCEQTSASRDDMNDVLEEIKTLREDVKQRVGEGLNGLSAAAARISAEVINELGGFHTQLHSSYSSLGKEFRTIFEDLIKHLEAQKSEADELRRQMSSASTTAMMENDKATSLLESTMVDERKQAKIDRETLLAQISGLISASGEAQDSRLAGKLGAIKEGISDSRTTFETARAKYNEGMSAWGEREQSLVDEVSKSRSTLKNKLKKDWNDANDQTTSIQTTTKAIHEETVRIVDAQIQDLGSQMQALDQFVTRARSQNSIHHDTHVKSLQGLASTVRESYAHIQGTFRDAQPRLTTFGRELEDQTRDLQAALPPIVEDAVKQPLSKLREDMALAPLLEYEPTGDTPPRTQYQYPQILPRTGPHQDLLSLTRPRSAGAELQRSPSKAPGMVFQDADISAEDEGTPNLQPMELDLASTLTTKEKPAGLREVAVNIHANSGCLSDSANSSAVSAGGSTATVVEIKAQPPLKKQHTMESKLPQKFSRSLRGLGVEGRENSLIPPSNFGASLGTGRRLRSSPPQ